MICEAALCIQQLREYKVLQRERERQKERASERERESLFVCLPLHLCAWVCFGGVSMFRYNVLCVVCVVVLMCLNLRSYGTSE